MKPVIDYITFFLPIVNGRINEPHSRSVPILCAHDVLCGPKFISTPRTTERPVYATDGQNRSEIPPTTVECHKG